MTTRSWWGWGNVEDAVTPDERRALVDRVRAVLPDADLTFHSPPDPTSLEVPPSRIQPPSDLYSTDAVDRLNLTVRPGRCYGFFGRNGAGKTTTIKCLLNLLRPAGGHIHVLGLDPRQAARTGSALSAVVIRHPGAVIPRAAMPSGLLPES